MQQTFGHDFVLSLKRGNKTCAKEAMVQCFVMIVSLVIVIHIHASGVSLTPSSSFICLVHHPRSLSSFNILVHHPCSSSSSIILVHHPLSSSSFIILIHYPRSSSSFIILIHHPRSLSSFEISARVIDLTSCLYPSGASSQ